MTQEAKYVPKHRAPGRHKRTRAGRPWAIGSGALVLTGIAVGGGLLGPGSGATDATATEGEQSVTTAALAALEVERRGASVTRSDRREARDPAKVAALAPEVGVVTTHRRTLSDEDPRDIARVLMADFGFASSEFSCLDQLWAKESGWRWDADNPTSSAYGIPQSLPGAKMASAGDDWETNPATQITWGLGYIKDRYGSPCAAWDHSQVNNWY